MGNSIFNLYEAVLFSGDLENNRFSQCPMYSLNRIQIVSIQSYSRLSKLEFITVSLRKERVILVIKALKQHQLHWLGAAALHHDCHDSVATSRHY